MKIVINICYGGFSISDLIVHKLNLNLEFNNSDCHHLCNEDLGIEDDNEYKFRADTRLIEAIEVVGLEEASGMFAKLKIVEIPDDVDWIINEYDGNEWVAEKHRTWF